MKKFKDNNYITINEHSYRINIPLKIHAAANYFESSIITHGFKSPSYRLYKFINNYIFRTNTMNRFSGLLYRSIKIYEYADNTKIQKLRYFRKS